MRAAIRLADRNQARMTVVDVVPPMPRLYRALLGQARVADAESGLVQHRQDSLRHLVDNTGAGADIDMRVLEGEPFIEVIRHVLGHGNDLVVLGDPEPEKGTVPGVSAGVMHVLRKCPVPVWVMRAPLAQPLRILALVDPDPTDVDRHGLNDLVLELARSLSQREGAELHVGHAWNLASESTLRNSPYVRLPDDVVDLMVASTEAAHREALGALVARHRLEEIGARVHTVPGEARQVLPDLAVELRAGLIVMGTVARTGLAGLIMGNTAESILRSVSCSVLAVKPEGFVSPIRPGRRRRR